MNPLKSLLVGVWLVLATGIGDQSPLVWVSAEGGHQQGALETPLGDVSAEGAPEGTQTIEYQYSARADDDPESTSDDEAYFEDEGNFLEDEGDSYAYDDNASTSSDFDVSDTGTDSEAPTDTSDEATDTSDDEADCAYYEDELQDAVATPGSVEAGNQP